MERLTPEQIRLLEELRQLRDSGILTVDEFEFQVAKVLGRPLVVEPLLVDEELSAPEDSPVAELLEYEFVEPEISGEDELLVEENQVVETLPTSDTSASSVVESEPQQNNSSRRKVLIGTSAGLVLVVVIAMLALGGGKSDSKSSQIVDNTTTVFESTSTERTDTPTSLGNTQAPAISSESVAITTTVPQNASSLNASRPTTATSTVVDNVNPNVTNLQAAYVGEGSIVKFTASIDNDEKLLACDCLDLWQKKGVGLSTHGNKWTRVQPGIWTTTFHVEPGNRYVVGLNEFCMYLGRFPGGPSGCAGPTVSFEVFERDSSPSPPTISDITISPATVTAGDTVTVNVRIVDNTGIEWVAGTLYFPGYMVYGGRSLSLVSGDLKDGIWSYQPEITIERGTGEICINALDIYSYGATFCQSITVIEPVPNGLETAPNS